ncbi:MAG: hypothetical protein PWR13_174 [Archaeoglobi archaeon]|nr:hypothetical protein [Candidatus Mnemosynella bozhongmuii]MDK2781146.1 hypothetical protein [Archaeoglobi archaeon]
MKNELIEKAFAYYSSHLFPWNFLLEPVSTETLRHYMKYAVPMSEKIKERLKALIESFTIDALDGDSGIEGLSSFDPLFLRKFITEISRKAVRDFLIDPENSFAKQEHGKHYIYYPFAYLQCLIFSIFEDFRIGGERISLSDIVDLKEIAKLLGCPIPQVAKKEYLMHQLYHEIKKKTSFWTICISGKWLVGKRVFYEDGKIIGRFHQIFFDQKTGKILQIIARPEPGADLSPLVKIGNNAVLEPQRLHLSNFFGDAFIYEFIDRELPDVESVILDDEE